MNDGKETSNTGPAGGKIASRLLPFVFSGTNAAHGCKFRVRMIYGAKVNPSVILPVGWLGFSIIFFFRETIDRTAASGCWMKRPLEAMSLGREKTKTIPQSDKVIFAG